ncbi:MAG: hypothetical protein K0R39_1708 [Symbiobacteriaceae bacterium]|jgi:hypothetical protein|nr:hypothetical protein [Symbiobacteriaceae bacterium]
MDFLMNHPALLYAYFGTFGSIGTILFVLVARSWLEYQAVAAPGQRSALRWSMAGYMFLFFGAWFACGIGGPPGNLLRPDSAAQNLLAGTGAAILSMLFSVPGWACVLVGQRKLLKEAMAQRSPDRRAA